MTDDPWTVQIGEVPDAGDTGIPPVPTEVFDGDEEGARAAFAEWSSRAQSSDTIRYVMLRNVGDVVEAWGTPPGAG